MEYRGSGRHLLCWSILQCFKLFLYIFFIFYLSIPIAPSLMPTIYLYQILHPKCHFNYLPVSYIVQTFYHTAMYLNSLVMPYNCIDFPSSLCAPSCVPCWSLSSLPSAHHPLFSTVVDKSIAQPH